MSVPYAPHLKVRPPISSVQSLFAMTNWRRSARIRTPTRRYFERLFALREFHSSAVKNTLTPSSIRIVAKDRSSSPPAHLIYFAISLAGVFSFTLVKPISCKTDTCSSLFIRKSSALSLFLSVINTLFLMG